MRKVSSVLLFFSSCKNENLINHSIDVIAWARREQAGSSSALLWASLEGARLVYVPYKWYEAPSNSIPKVWFLSREPKVQLPSPGGPPLGVRTKDGSGHHLQLKTTDSNLVFDRWDFLWHSIHLFLVSSGVIQLESIMDPKYRPCHLRCWVMVSWALAQSLSVWLSWKKRICLNNLRSTAPELACRNLTHWQHTSPLEYFRTATQDSRGSLQLFQIDSSSVRFSQVEFFILMPVSYPVIGKM